MRTYKKIVRKPGVVRTHRRSKQVKTTKKHYGSKHYSIIAKMSRENATTLFDSESGKRAINKRWDAYRSKKAEELRGRS